MQNNQTCGPFRIDEFGNSYRLKPAEARYGQCKECELHQECCEEAEIHDLED